MRVRWQQDERGLGTAAPPDAVAGLEHFSAEMRTDGWLTESPELHLLPKLREWLAAHDEWRLDSAEETGGWWQLRMQRASAGRMRDVRADTLALIGSFAEATTMVRQIDLGGEPAFEVATGQPDDPAGFASHGLVEREAASPRQASCLEAEGSTALQRVSTP